MQTPPANKVSEQDPLDLDAEVRVGGEYLKAFAAAHEAFKSDPLIPAEKKRLENYNVEFRQSGDLYHVLFSAKRLPHERELDGGESELGKDVMYTIRKADYQIVKRLFYR